MSTINIVINQINEMLEANKQSELKPGDTVLDGRFRLVKKITSMDEFWEVIKEDRSIWAINKVWPTAFLFSLKLNLAKRWIDRGIFWKVERMPNVKTNLFRVLKCKQCSRGCGSFCCKI